MKKCTLNFLCNLFANQDTYEKSSSAFLVSHEEWKQNHVLTIELVALGHVLLPKNLTKLILDFYNSQNKSNKIIHSSQHL